MKSNRRFNRLLALIAGFALAIPAAAQERDRQSPQTPASTQEREVRTTQPSTIQTPQTLPSDTQVAQETAQMMRIPPGEKEKIEGVIIRRDPDSFIMRDENGMEFTVKLETATKVVERKRNPFRSAKKYPITSLLRGLEIQVEGRGDDTGALVADRIRFTDDDYDVARSIESRVTPVETHVTRVEGRVESAEARLTQAEANAQRLSGQLEELAAVANTARGGAKAAQETADAAITAVRDTNVRISALDDFDATKNIAVNFRVNSATLSPEAQATLDEIANQAKTEKGYIIQVTGFASADGNEMYNRRLSERRAESVVRYLAENHDIPLRRIITPFGFGEAKPVADNSTREGRMQNRRVEVAILVNKGLTTPVSVNVPGQTASSEAPRTRPDNQPQRP